MYCGGGGGLTDTWTDGRMDEWMDEKIDGWT